MTNRTCSIPDCDKPFIARGYCGMHYKRWSQTGTTDLVPKRRKTMQERFWAKVDKAGTIPAHDPSLGRCWQWVGGKGAKGYGTFWDGERVVPAHKVHWQWVNGPVPAGIVLDHVCHNKGCVNLRHIRTATNKENCEYRNGPNTNNRTSGVRGVVRNGSGWRVEVRHNGEKLQFGTYRTIAEAEKVAIRERARLFRFAEVGLNVA